MPDRDWAGQGFHQAGLGEIIPHISKPADRIEALGKIMADDSAGFLSPVLKGVQTKRDEIGGFGNAVYAKYTTFFV